MKQWLKILTDQKKLYFSWLTEDYGGANDQNPYTEKRSVISSDYDQFRQSLLMTLYNSLHF